MSFLPNKKISVILVNYRSEKNIFRCLLSVKNFLRNVAHEIIIVNNDKEEDLNEVKKRFAEITIINQTKNIGFGRAINVGVEMAKGEILFFLNPDAEIVFGKIAEVARIFSGDKNVGILGCRIVSERGQVQPWIAGVEKTFWDLLKNNLGIKKSQKIWKAKQKTRADWVAATAMFIRKDLFNYLGGFDNNIFLYFEDVDLCARAAKTGAKIIFFPGFMVRHKGGASFKDKKAQKKYYYASQEYYFQKHCQKWEAVIIKLIGKIFYAI